MEFGQNIDFLFNSVLKVGKFVKASVRIEKSSWNLFWTFLGDVDRKQRQKQFLKNCNVFCHFQRKHLYSSFFFWRWTENKLKYIHT
jgi:hypothetical protein